MARSRDDWIVDSGVTSHMCNNPDMFTELDQLGLGEKVTLGDGSPLDVIGQGTVSMDMVLGNGGRRRCILKKVLYVSKLDYNLISVSRAVQSGKSVLFNDSGCEFVNESSETMAVGVRRGCLHYLNCSVKPQESVHVIQTDNRERLWHRRFGHLNEQSMRQLVREDLVDHLDYSRNVKFDEREPEGARFEEERHVDQPLILNSPNEAESDDGGVEEEIETGADPPAAEPPPRRTTRERRPVEYYGFPQAHITVHQEPASFKEATACPEGEKWREAMGREMESLKEHEVWELTTLPPGKKAVGSKWVYKVKTNSDGSLERYKARLVARGFDQRYGSDYDETFCPVVRLESLRTLIALSTQRGLKLHHVDVHTAFLNGTLQEEVYMQQPTGYEEKGKEHLVCRLRKSIYGLKQSSRCWNTALDSHLKEMGFFQSKSDPYIYVSGERKNAFYIGVYVDNMILGGKDESRMEDVKKELSLKFDINNLGNLSYFLGMSVVRNQEEKESWIGQPAYIQKLLSKTGMSDCKPVKTPVDPGQRLVKALETEEAFDQQLYQSVVGSLMYLATCTRPDIAYAVGMLARFASKPNQSHWTAAKRMLRYLRGTDNLGILYKGESEIQGYSDADWAGDTDDRKSTSGYLFLIAEGSVSWKSRKQSTVALSTAEAEYVALSAAVQECMWIQRLLSELGNPPHGPTTILEDNQSSIAMARNPQFHGRAKHIDIKHHFVREQVSNGSIKLQYCPTEDMLADVLMKGLAQQRYSTLRERAGIVPQMTSIGTEMN